MSQSARKKWLIAALAAIAVAAASAGIWFLRESHRGNPVGRPVPAPASDSGPGSRRNPVEHLSSRPGDVMITLPSDKVENAHLKIEEAVLRPGLPAENGGLRTTGTVQSNAYKEVPVVAVAGGIVREVKAALGDQVSRGQELAVVFSPELAEAETAYLTMQAEIERHHQHYHRAEQLVEIGAISREDFEAAQAEYKTEQARLTSARQRLLYLGLSTRQVDGLKNANQVSAIVSIQAPAAGVVISRTVNAGEAVMIGKELLKVADLTTVWVIGQIYEPQSALVRVGTRAAVLSPALPGRSLTGRVSYVDPRVDPQTRTVQVRIELGNPGRVLKLGMFVDVYFGDGKSSTSVSNAVSVPENAVQNIGAKKVVFIAIDKPGTFLQREVTVGAVVDGSVPIYSGLSGGERLVTDGSFLLRSESVKLNPSQ